MSQLLAMFVSAVVGGTLGVALSWRLTSLKHFTRGVVTQQQINDCMHEVQMEHFCQQMVASPEPAIAAFGKRLIAMHMPCGDTPGCTRDHSVRRELETEIENVIGVKA